MRGEKSGQHKEIIFSIVSLINEFIFLLLLLIWGEAPSSPM